MPTSPRVMSVLVLLLAVFLFNGWYRGGHRLQPAEIERLMNTIVAQGPEVIGDLDTEAFRAFLENDDGLPFYNLNLFKFRADAAYPVGSTHGGTGREAFQRYAQFMISALPRRASHVTFAARPIVDSDWDQVAIARYRSRRDLAELFASREFSAAVVHKWAALERNVRLPLQSKYWFVPAYGLAVLATLVILAALRILWAAGHRVSAWWRDPSTIA